MKSVLVTGAAGFMGSFLVEELVSRGYSVVGVDNLFRGKIKNLTHVMDSGRFIFDKIDLSLPQAKGTLNCLLKERKIGVIFHLAAINGTQYFYDRPTFVLDQNTKITINVMESMEGTGVKYIIYTSSSEVYGEPLQIPTPETHPILLHVEADRDSYASSKAIGEFYTRLYAQRYGLDFLVLRIFNMYGERMDTSRYGQVIPEFIKRMLLEESFTIIGDGTHTRSFCYIRDASSLLVQLMERNLTGILNLGNDREISILDLARRIHEVEGAMFNPVFLPERPNDHKRRRPDITKLRSLFPAFKFTPLEEGLLRTIDFYKKNGA